MVLWAAQLSRLLITIKLLFLDNIDIKDLVLVLELLAKHIYVLVILSIHKLIEFSKD